MKRVIRTATGLLASLIIGLSCAQASSLSQRDDIKQFIEELANTHQFDKQQLQQWFNKTELQPKIIEAISKPAEKTKPWYEYRKIFIKPDRIDKGVSFWKKYEEALNRAEKEYGVPPHIITAIIGVETRYGEYKGRHRVMDALTTLSFDYPKRSRFFKSELTHYLLLTREEDIDPFSIKGSYAGAMGIPQFISSSYRSYAVDFDGDGKRDLWDNPVDAIGSVANYFKQHGWKAGEEVVLPATVNGKQYQHLVEKGLKPHTPVAEFANHGVIPGIAKGGNHGSAALIELEQPSNKEYWLALDNFYAITRYNHSALYAMAAYQLSLEIKKAYGES